MRLKSAPLTREAPDIVWRSAPSELSANAAKLARLPAGLRNFASILLFSQEERDTGSPRAQRHPALQFKLAIGSAHHPLEAEADRVADEVVKPGAAAAEDLPVRTSRVSAAVDLQTTASQRVEAELSVAGQPLESSTRSHMERRFGHNFERVRIHDGASAAESARTVGARAFTSGSDIVFGQGYYRPGTAAGRHLLAHELTHVVQQGGSLLPRSALSMLQRNAVPVSELWRRRDQIDVQLQNPKLVPAERTRLLEERLSLTKLIGDEVVEPEDYSDSGRPLGQPNPSSGIPGKDPNLPAAPLPDPPGAKAKPLKPKGAGSQAKSAKALGTATSKTPSLPPPSTPYRNENPRATKAEIRAGQRLNELAIAGKLGDVSAVVGRPEVPPNTADYAFFLRDGTEIKADLYSPTSKDNKAEDIALHVTAKSGQADVVVVELNGLTGRQALEKGHQIADALIASANTNIKRIIILSDERMVLNRSLDVKGTAILRVRERVEKRMEDRNGPREVPPTDPREVRTEAQRGGPDANIPAAARTEAVSEALGRQTATAGAIEGAAQMILSAQFGSIQDKEIRKIYVRLGELSDRIEELRRSGFSVNVMGKAEVPDTLDVAGGATGTRDISQIVYFNDLWLVPHRPISPNAVPNPTSSMSGDPTAPRGGDSTAERALEASPHPYHHFWDALFMTFDPYPQTRK